MSWATRRRLFILLTLLAVVSAIVAVTVIATTHHTPTCTDGIQNRDEQGVDCGGLYCTYLCTALEQPPTILFTKAIQNGVGRTDVIAEIENKNATAAAKRVSYTITLFDATHALVQSVQGSVELPPQSVVPVFVPGVASGNQVVTSAFLSIDSSKVEWYQLSQDPRVVPRVTHVTTVEGSAPRVEATLENPSTVPLRTVQAVVMVRDARGNVIAASKTIVPHIPAQGTASATFTWNAPFSSQAVTTEVVPVVPLP